MTIQKILTPDQLSTLPGIWIEDPRANDPQIVHKDQRRYRKVENFDVPISKLSSAPGLVMAMVRTYHQPVVITKWRKKNVPRLLLGFLIPVGLTYEQLDEINEHARKLMAGELAEVMALPMGPNGMRELVEGLEEVIPDEDQDDTIKRHP